MWVAYKLIYKAISPIHIGWHTLGYIKLTRYYIPGRNIWAAFTENTVHSLQIDSEKINNIYIEVGKMLKEDILVSYFYPCIGEQDKKLDIPLLPKYSNKGFTIGKYTKSEFENKFIKSYGQTAIVPESNTAEDESLHESEYISPTIDDDGKIKQVFFVGYVFLKNEQIDLPINNKVIGWDSGDIKLKEAITELFVGGDRKYGWGRLCLEKPEKIEDGNTIFENENNGYKIILDNEKYPIIEINNNNCNIPAHLPFSSSVKLKGDLEPLIGREYEVGKDSNHKNSNRLGSGQKINSFIENDKVFWVPGSSIVTEKSPIKLQISEYGILREINEK